MHQTFSQRSVGMMSEAEIKRRLTWEVKPTVNGTLRGGVGWWGGAWGVALAEGGR